MLKIHKYPLLKPVNTLQMSAGAEMLDVQAHLAVPTLWVLEDSDNELAEFIVSAYETGESIPKFISHTYIATLQSPNGMTFHYFEVGND